ncbi:hypothetical protein GCM10009647_034960 [Streptomyces sanglieri]
MAAHFRPRHDEALTGRHTVSVRTFRRHPEAIRTTDTHHRSTRLIRTTDPHYRSALPIRTTDPHY